MHKPLFIALGALAVVACSHEGGGSGTLEKPAYATTGTESEPKSAGKVEFTWESGADASKGKITATAPDGRMFQGTYLQPSSVVRQDDYAPYWDAWSSSSWGSASPWYVGAEDDFVTSYSGKALAHLTSSDGTRMRCTFMLRDPISGLSGGGEGDCQLSTNERIFGARLHSK